MNFSVIFVCNTDLIFLFFTNYVIQCNFGFLRFDPAANAWTQGPGLNVARYGHGLVSDGFSLYAIGGTYK